MTAAISGGGAMTAGAGLAAVAVGVAVGNLGGCGTGGKVTVELAIATAMPGGDALGDGGVPLGAASAKARIGERVAEGDADVAATAGLVAAVVGVGVDWTVVDEVREGEPDAVFGDGEAVGVVAEAACSGGGSSSPELDQKPNAATAAVTTAARM
ncbi:MAG: hypothetical protein QM775_09965 [Pirellulales bacterium]